MPYGFVDSRQELLKLWYELVTSSNLLGLDSKVRSGGLADWWGIKNRSLVYRVGSGEKQKQGSHIDYPDFLPDDVSEPMLGAAPKRQSYSP